MILNCAVIDDEPLARECMEGYIREIDFLQLAGSGNNPLELGRLMATAPVDLILLDIHMPVMSGIDFLKVAPVRPMVIITSAYPQYALEGYQLDVLDYLVKPIIFSRFYKAATKAMDYARMMKPPTGTTLTAEAAQEITDNFFFIKCDYRYEKIFFDDILFIEAVQNYVSINTIHGKFMTLLYLKNMDEKLDPKKFIRVHKSFMIAVDKVKAIENNEIIIGNFRVPISRNYRDGVLSRVVDGRLWQK